MGTHISKVKSVDLDTWTPEQMDVSINAHIALMYPDQHSQYKNGEIIARICIGRHI